MMRISFLGYAIIFVCISYYLCDDDFDKKVLNIDSQIIVKVNGYRNFKNRGVYKGCCGNSTKRICNPCRMMFVIQQRPSYSYTTNNYKNTTIAVFSKESNELYERFEKYWLFSSTKYRYLQVLMYNFNLNDSTQEEFTEIDSPKFTKYEYDGVFGVKNILEIWAEIIIKPTSFDNKYRLAIMRIDSLYFNEFRNFDMQCCNDDFDDICENECPYYIKWEVGYSSRSSTHITPISNNRQQNISITLTSTAYFSLFKENIDYTLTIYSNSNGQIMDLIKITKINDFPNLEYKLLNVLGGYGNIIFNISWMHNCQIYGGINCKLECTADLGTEYCDLLSDNTKCINGASDPNTCINLPTECKQDTCSNHGICMLNQGIAMCNCEPGYIGKFCQDYQCDSGCNGNGRCIGPNKCSCYPPSTGKDCDEFPCDDEIAKICGHYGHCKIFNGIPHCDCLNKLIKGANCTEAICDNDCVFGKCVYNMRLDLTNCVCNELYEGPTCNVTIKFFDQTNARAKLSATVAVIVIAIIVLIILVVLIYYNIDKLNFKQFNFFKESNEELNTGTDYQK